MCIICSTDPANLKDVLKDTKVIDCEHCDILNIPYIEGLNELCCEACWELRHVSHIEGLKKLNVGNCRSLTEIPHISSLEELYCYDCPLLTCIPYIENLKRLGFGSSAIQP